MVAQAFDTGAATSGRQLLRGAICDQLEQLTRDEGLYMAAVIPLPAPFTDDDDVFAHMLEDIVAGRAPSVAIALGESKGKSGGAGYGDEWTVETEVFAYCICKSGADTMKRLTGDAVSALAVTKDPGVEVALEHVLERLAGFRPEATGLSCNELRPLSVEPAFYLDAETSIGRIALTVKHRADVNRLRSFTQLLLGIDATHGEDDADAGAVRPTLPTETDIEP